MGKPGKDGLKKVKGGVEKGPSKDASVKKVDKKPKKDDLDDLDDIFAMGEWPSTPGPFCREPDPFGERAAFIRILVSNIP